MTLHYPQIILIILLAIELGATIAMHGKLKEGSYARYSFPRSLLGTVIIFVLLYCGGFFS